MTHDQQLSDLQLDIMRILWAEEEATAVEVRDSLVAARSLALTTVSTVLSRLEKRGLVEHRNEGRQFVYRALVKEDSVLHSDLDELTERWFSGDMAALMSHLLDARGISPGDLTRVRALLDSRIRGGGKRRGNR